MARKGIINKLGVPSIRNSTVSVFILNISIGNPAIMNTSFWVYCLMKKTDNIERRSEVVTWRYFARKFIGRDEWHEMG